MDGTWKRHGTAQILVFQYNKCDTELANWLSVACTLGQLKLTLVMQAHGRTSSSPHPLIIPFTRQSMPMSSTSQIWTFGDTCMLPPTAMIRASNGPCESLSFRNAIMFTVSIGAGSVQGYWILSPGLTPYHTLLFETVGVVAQRSEYTYFQLR